MTSPKTTLRQRSVDKMHTRETCDTPNGGQAASWRGQTLPPAGALAATVGAAVDLLGIAIEHAVLVMDGHGEEVCLYGDVLPGRWQAGEILTVTLRGLDPSGREVLSRARITAVRATPSHYAVELRLIGSGAQSVARMLATLAWSHPSLS